MLVSRPVALMFKPSSEAQDAWDVTTLVRAASNPDRSSEREVSYARHT